MAVTVHEDSSGGPPVTSRWLNCLYCEGAVLSGSIPRAVLLNDSIYMNGSRSKDIIKIWKYSISKNTLTSVDYPTSLIDSVLCNEHTIIDYQSQLLWIGNRDINTKRLGIFTPRNDEEVESWEEIMPNFSKEMLRHMKLPAWSFGVSSASVGKYLIVVVSEPQLLSVLIFDGQEWRRRDGPDCTAPTHGRPDTIIYDGIIFLITYRGFYKISLKDILKTSNPQWKPLTTIATLMNRRSNLTSFDGRIVVLTPGNGYVRILAYESVMDTWIILEKLDCHISWVIPTILGLPGGRLLIFGVVPDQQATQIPQFNVLEVTAKGDEGEHIRATLQAMEKQGVLNHSFVHGVFIGPARSGKNSLMERLLGKMPSSKSPSTGIAEAVVQVQVQKSKTMAANVEGSLWSQIDDDDEAIRLMVLHRYQENIQFERQNMATSAEPHASINPIEDNVSSLSISIPNAVPNSYESDPRTADATHMNNKWHLPTSNVPPHEILKTAIKFKGLQALQQHFDKTWSLYLSNTGGQMEFQEVLPLLVSGPCMFFYTFQIDRDLNECYEIHYELPDGTISDPYKSSITTIEGIVQSLASIAAMGVFVYRGSQKCKVRLRPKVLFIDTHKDQLNHDQATDVIASIDQNLQKSTAQFSSIIEFAPKDQMIFAVNNFSQDRYIISRYSFSC